MGYKDSKEKYALLSYIGTQKLYRYFLVPIEKEKKNDKKEI